ncbi:MAG: class I SAM-dependent DNA methyltransferase, partial [Candidatus Levyibacteriota bacterium]
MAQYDSIASLYDEQMCDDGDLHHQYLFDPPMAQLLPHEANSVLDAGCGNGYWAMKLAKKYKKVTAIDNSEELIKIAKAKRSLPNITYKQVDIE